MRPKRRAGLGRADPVDPNAEGGDGLCDAFHHPPVSNLQVLLTADLHLLRATADRTLQALGGWIERHKPDALVVAGDLASAPQAANCLQSLRAVFPEGPLAVCLGNHDFWLHDAARGRCRDLPAVVEEVWRPAAAAAQVTLLDVENLALPGLTVVGGYGHYDLGFAIPGLRYGSLTVSAEDYGRGHCPEVGPMRWRDVQLMPAGLDAPAVARQQAEAIGRRLADAGDAPVLFVSHVPPFEELLGTPTPGQGPHPPIAFFRAYLGSRLLGETLRPHVERLVGIACGHTHRAVGPQQILGVPAVNVGSDYGAPRGVWFDGGARRFRRISP